MKILFVLKQRNYLHTFSGFVEALHRRGHSVRLAWPDDDLSLPEELAALPITVDHWHPKRSDAWAGLVGIGRRGHDYLRYLRPAYRGAAKLRGRAFDKLLHSLSSGAREPGADWADTGLGLTDAERERLLTMTALIEDAIPSDARTEALIARDRPDVVLVSPLIDLGSAQTDVVKSAAALGIPTGMVLFSWDNLSTKGGLHVHPDWLFVWNERQRREAQDLHGYPIERTVAAGAPRFDDFCRLTPACSRTEFFEPLGLDPAQPTVMYLGSSKFVTTGEELPFIREWVHHIRSSEDAALRACNIIVRPHPDVKAWDGEGEATQVRWARMGGKGLVTRPFDTPRAIVLRSHYRKAQAFFDALHHSTAVVGLNTSAALEAALAGRPVFTILAGEEVADGQRGTLHFHYLLTEHGGCVTPASTLEEHAAQLGAALAGPDDSARVRAFARAFTRPANQDEPASVALAAAVEAAFATAVARDGAAVPPRAVAATVAGAAAAAPVTPAREAPAAPAPAAIAPEAAARAGKAAAAEPQIVRLDFPHTDIHLYATSDPERRWRARACAKEPWTVEWLLENVRAGETLYDIGANVGTFALIAARHCGASVVAFEPGYATFAHLCDNIQLNGCSRAIVPVPLPLADKTGLLSFKYRSVDPGQSRHQMRDARWSPGTPADGDAEQRYIQPVCAMTLDSAVAQFGLDVPHHIKLDVDGAELRVLEGAPALLRNRRLKTLLVEIDAGLWDDVHDCLARAGLRLRTRHKRPDKPNAPTYAVFARA